MKFVIISHVPHGIREGRYFAYAPYVREMNIWLKFVDEVIIAAPLTLAEQSPIHSNYEHRNITFKTVKQMDLLSFQAKLSSILHMPKTVMTIFKAIYPADHIHLRCPGNIGLIGCFVQILFPGKIKTAKYAGNWDPNATQPLSYRIQKWILNNTILTQNMQALVYGTWPNASKNIKPFFTATYYEADKIDMSPRALNQTIHFLYVGTLSTGKRPLYAIQLVEELTKRGVEVSLELFGEGLQMQSLQQYCHEKQLNTFIFFHGNQTESVVRQAYQQSHFILLPSQSEGWPKVVAEAMFWGCLPVASAVSSVPFMLDYGHRGILLNMNLLEDVEQLEKMIGNQLEYNNKVLKSIAWSREYTLDLFQNRIKALLNQ